MVEFRSDRTRPRICYLYYIYCAATFALAEDVVVQGIGLSRLYYLS